MERFSRTLRDIQSKINQVILHEEPPLSPVPDLLRSNTPPSEVQIYLIHEAIAGVQTELSSLEFQLHRSPDNAALLRRRVACENFIVAHRRVLSLERRLPFEILIEIFSWFIPPLDPSDMLMPLPSLYIRHWTPLRLVCRRWREGIHAVPRLFSYPPKIQLNQKTEDSRYVQQLKRYLSWSGDSMGLQLYIYGPFREYDSHPALEVVMGCSTRWEALYAEVAFSTLRSLSKVTYKLESLRYVALDIWGYSPIIHPGKFGVFAKAKRLEVVKVNGVFPEGMELPWESLIEYREKVVNRGGVRQVAARCHRLERLELTQNIDVPLTDLATLANLKAIKFRYDNAISPDNAINKLVVPSLEDAQILGTSGDILPALSAMISRSSGCTGLRRLAFRTPEMVPGELNRLLLHTPMLEELDINHPPSEDAGKLIAGDGGVTMLPNLEKLWIHSSGSWGNEEIYGQIARSRSVDGGVTVRVLKEFRLIFEHADVCATHQAFYEDWFDPMKHASPSVQTLMDLRKSLLSLLPEIDPNKADSGVPRRRVLDLGFSNHLNSVITSIENTEVTDVQELHISKIHLALKSITKIRANHIPSDEKLRFRERAGEILRKWKPLFAETIDKVRWARVGKRSLVYISQSNDARLKEGFVDDFVYGMDDWVHDFYLFWYRYM